MSDRKVGAVNREVDSCCATVCREARSRPVQTSSAGPCRNLALGAPTRRWPFEQLQHRGYSLTPILGRVPCPAECSSTEEKRHRARKKSSRRRSKVTSCTHWRWCSPLGAGRTRNRGSARLGVSGIRRSAVFGVAGFCRCARSGDGGIGGSARIGEESVGEKIGRRLADLFVVGVTGGGP